MKSSSLSSWIPNVNRGLKTGPTVATPGMLKPGIAMSGKLAVKLVRVEEGSTCVSSSI